MEESDDHIEELFQLCVRMYERMERDGTWPWTVDADGNRVLIKGRALPDKFEP